MSRQRTEDDDIGNRVTADTVTAVDTANHFTRCIRARNDLMRGIQHFRFSVDGHAAHGVVYTWRNLNGVERAFVNRSTQRGGTTEIFIVLFFHKAIVTFKRGKERMIVNAQFVRQFARRAGAGHQAFRNVLVSRFVFRSDMLIKHDVSVMFRQRDDCR